MNETIIISAMFFALGAIIGSFLNVCIVRMPHEQSVIVPRSHCVHCKTQLAWYDNVPFFSYLALRGKCRTCKKPISFRYFFVELLTASVFAGMFLYYGLTPVLAPYLVMICGFIVATMVDFEHRIIPDEISVGGMFVGFIFSLFMPQLHGAAHYPGIGANFVSLGWSIFGAFIGGASIYLMGLLGDFIFKKESMGGGDVKMMAMIGAFLGWKLALLTFFVAPFFGAVYGIIEKIRTKDSAIAYGPFIVLGAIVSMFWGNEIIRFILSGYGFYGY